MVSDIEWIDIVERRQSVLFASLITKEDNHKYCLQAGIDYTMNDYRYVDGKISFSGRDMNRLFGLFYERLHREKGFLSSFAAACYQQCDRLVKKASEISEMADLPKLKKQELADVFKDYAEQAFKLLPYLYSGNVIEILLHQEITNELKVLTGEDSDIDRYLSVLIIPSKENAIVSEMNNLLKTGYGIQQRKSLSNIFRQDADEVERALPEVDAVTYSLLKDHVKEYGWLNLHSGYLGRPMTINEVVRRIKNLIRRDCGEEIAKRQKASQSRERAFDDLVSTLRIEGTLLETIKNARDFIDVRMERINVYFVAHFKVLNLMNALASALDIGYESLLFLTYEEILDALESLSSSSVDLSEIEGRKTGYALVMIDGHRAIYTGPELERLRPEEPKEDYGKISSFEGTSACLGEVVAPAKILLSVNDVDKVAEGDIVVSPMTTPDLMSALERASGVITDEGGILCHAAIVSRELGIPCIIGTKLATRIIRDGDDVSLIATEQKGLVRLVDRQEQPATDPWWHSRFHP